jgi:hypothetical protein
MKKVISVLILIAVSVFTVFPVNAADRVLRVHTFELDDFDEIEINNSVGSIDLRLVEGNEIRVEVDIEAQDRYFGREVDVDDIEVGVRMRGDKLILTIDEDKIKAHWYIEMPAVANIEIDMGVGEIDVEIEASNLEVNLGVGEVDIIAPLLTVGEIDLSAGVGDTNIRGTSEVDNSRTVVASESEGYGDGEFSIDVDVGVGDVTVELI